MIKTLLAAAIALLPIPALPAEMAFEKELASATGWRNAAWGMSVAELSSALGKDFQEQKRPAKQKDNKVVIRGKSKTKLSLDGLDFEVKFGFNPADRLNGIFLVCEKAKQASVPEIRQRLAERFGQSHSQQRHYRRVGFALVPDIQEQIHWRNDLLRVELSSLQIRPNIFMWIRRFSVGIIKEDSPQAFDDLGSRHFSGEVRELLDRGTIRWCALQVNIVKHSVTLTCDKGQIVVDQALTPEDKIHIEPGTAIGELTVQTVSLHLKNRPAPLRLSIGTDAATLLQETIPSQSQ